MGHRANSAPSLTCHWQGLELPLLDPMCKPGHSPIGGGQMTIVTPRRRAPFEDLTA